MGFEDRISIAVPEGLDLDLDLAGLGSRFVATLVDQLLRWAVLVPLGIVVGLLAAASGGRQWAPGVAAGVLLVVVFVVQFGYDVVFETLASGRTPGKRWTGLRVVRLDGAPVGFTTSAVRNLLRLVDFLPFSYAVGIVAILASARNQRLGDLAAGTLVVRERKARPPDVLVAPEAGAAADVALWDVSAVSADEVATVRRFLDRRSSLTPEARARLAWELATRLRHKVAGPPEDIHPETFLVELAAAKAARR